MKKSTTTKRNGDLSFGFGSSSSGLVRLHPDLRPLVFREGSRPPLKEKEEVSGVILKTSSSCIRGRQHTAAAVASQLRYWTTLQRTRVRLQRLLAVANRFPPGHNNVSSPRSSSLPPSTFLNDDDAVDKEEEEEEESREPIDDREKQRGVLLTDVQRKAVHLLLQFILPQKNVEPTQKNVEPTQKNVEPTPDHSLDDRSLDSLPIRNRTYATVAGGYGGLAAAGEQTVWTRVCWPPHQRSQCLHILDQWKTKTQVEKQRVSFKVLNQTPSEQLTRAMQEFPKILKANRAAYLYPQVIGASRLDKEEVCNQLYEDQDSYVKALSDIVNNPYGVVEQDEVFLKASQQEARRAGIRRRDMRKVEREYDRRGSKGRKIRYVAIPKLASFMTAIPRSSSSSRVRVGLPGGSDPTFVKKMLRSLFQ